MHKKAQKVEWKTQSKMSCHYTWLLHAKKFLSRWRFLRSFLTASKPSRRSITAAKRKEREEKERRKKKIPKIEKPKDIGHFPLQKLSQNFDFCAGPSHNTLKCNPGGKKGKRLCCKCIFEWIKGNLAEIQPKNDQNVHKTHFLQKVPGVDGLTNSCILNFLGFCWTFCLAVKKYNFLLSHQFYTSSGGLFLDIFQYFGPSFIWL